MCFRKLVQIKAIKFDLNIMLKDFYVLLFQQDLKKLVQIKADKYDLNISLKDFKCFEFIVSMYSDFPSLGDRLSIVIFCVK